MQTNRAQPVVILLLGAASVLLQTAALRSFLAVFAGNELVMGIALGVWLACAGAGSMAGRSFSRPAPALGVVVLLAGILAQPFLSALPLIRPVLALAAGETIPLGATVLSAFLVLGPVCFLIGLQFPLVTACAGRDAARVYRIEAGGAMLGGALFTFALAGRAGEPALLAAISTLYLAIGAWLLRRPIGAALLLLPLLVPFGIERLSAAFGEQGPAAVLHRESRYGPIDVYQRRGQTNIFASGKYVYAYPDQQTEEQIAHLAASLHPAPRRILLLGGSPAVACELLKYRGATVEFLEIDPALIEISASLLTPGDRRALDSGHYRAIAADPRRFLRDRRAAGYDLVLLNLSEPSTASINRFYTEEFFHDARRAMARDGVIVLNLPSSPGYQSGRMRQALGAVFQALSGTFRHCAVASSEYGLLIGSDSEIISDPEQLRMRYSLRRIVTESFHAGLLADAFDPFAVSRTRERLAAVTAVNSDARPIAYLNNLLAWADMHGNRVLPAIVDHVGALLLLLAFLGMAMAWMVRGGPGVISAAVFLGGFASMSFSVVLLLAFQSAFGSIYERVGLMTALFMAGSSLGATLPISDGWTLARLRLVEGAAAALFATSLLLPGSEILYYLFSGCSGIAGGALFAAAVRSGQGGGPPGAAGMLYGLDLAGGFLGALVTALLLVPLFGIARATLVMVGSKALSLVLLFTLRHETD